MLIYFLRHAEAEDLSTSDFDRKLTPKGLEQAEKVAKFCSRNGLLPDIVVTSPVVRAEQTATIVAKRLGDLQLVVEPWLACGMSIDLFLNGIGGYGKFEQVMVVGHEPDFSETISSLMGLGDSEAINIRKSSLTAIDLRGLREGVGRLQFSVPVRLM